MNFIKIDDETIRSELLSAFEAATGVALKEGDARRIFLEQFAVPLVAQYNAINSAGKQNLIQYAYGAFLDAIGARWGDLGARLPAQKAVTVLEFTLSAAQDFDVIIPKGTRATTADNSLFFAVTEDLTIPTGETAKSITAEAVESGVKYNGLAAGTINKIVDPVAYVASVINTITSHSGADVETDDDYRDRLMLVSSAPSTAGSAEGYKYWALKADSTIVDVSVISLSAGNVTITILCRDGEEPDSNIINKVEKLIDERRPLTDLVTVQAPTNVDYSIEFTYYINSADLSQLATIQANVEAAVNEYIKWQSASLGRSINPDELRKRVLNAGASRLTVVEPNITNVELDEYAKLAGSPSITYGGIG